ncbi:GNAT family protein [Streptomyces sp. H10-C2]|uniref:GNAT family N-acetyltransferase n=1 Tax=unclassified Streptomyces TaxID=2593676 RepID=UPI0024BBA99F|nr:MULTISPECIES: GNAT family protein [unclassified Streptomyces]MDJ0347451.1 GNAT family protein [Streptomyces sp. PH10-H1]MDJ0375667.1 GNAT family protein [Streptomyces sp. H10-C2]
MLEHDLVVLEQFLTDPEAIGPFQWQGWSDPGRWRRRWAEDGLLGEDGGQLMVVTGADRLGFVAWRKVMTSRISYCWNIGIQLLPEGRGRGAGTQAQRLLVRYLFAHTQVFRIEASTESAVRTVMPGLVSLDGVALGHLCRSGVRGSLGWRDEWSQSVPE